MRTKTRPWPAVRCTWCGAIAIEGDELEHSPDCDWDEADSEVIEEVEIEILECHCGCGIALYEDKYHE